jgi:small subunit ribosomal protein S15
VARIYSRKKGKHGSKKPPVKIVPRWVKYKKADVEKIVIDLANQKHNSAVIGLILRDQYGIPDVKTLVGKTVVQMMKENKLYPDMPEEMYYLLKKAVNLREHLGKNRGDACSKKGLENLESKIRRLGKYYVREGKLPKNWRYSAEEAKLIVQK